MDRQSAKSPTKPTASKSQAAATTSKSATPKQNDSTTEGVDAIALLTADHQRVKQMFEQYEKLGEDAVESKAELAQQICMEITVHAQVEEEILYPAVRDAIDDDDLMDEADVEHAAARDLVAQIEEMDPEESHYDAKVKVLGEEIEHHVKEEQDEMFTKAKRSGLDLEELGRQIGERKAQLLRKMEQGARGRG